MAMHRDAPLIEALKPRGAITRIALAAGVTPSAVSQWRRVPAEHVGVVADISGMSASELRPDLALAFKTPATEPA